MFFIRKILGADRKNMQYIFNLEKLVVIAINLFYMCSSYLQDVSQCMDVYFDEFYRNDSG